MTTLGDVSVADAEPVKGAVPPGTEGAVQCKAPGCENWFVKASGRHAYCKLANCTYRRGAVPEQELTVPTGAAAELLLRLQDPEGGGEVGPEVLPTRLRAVGEAQRSGDQEALYGALVDAGVVIVRYADRVRLGTLPPRTARQPSAPSSQSTPVGLVHAALASHARTVTLAERRYEAVWTLFSAREQLHNAERGEQQTRGTEQSIEADGLLQEARQALKRAEMALAALDAAWGERREALGELERAGASVGAPVGRGGATNGAGRRPG